MEQIAQFLTIHGWQLTLIALAGLIILGVLKYTNVFSKIEKQKRKPIYFAISVGFSLVATVIYLLCIKQFNFEYLVTVTTAIYALNQAMYAVYETTTLRELVSKALKAISTKLDKKKGSE